jgi:hypothetical protein
MFRMPHARYAIIGVRYNLALRGYVFGYQPGEFLQDVLIEASDC